MILPLTVPKLDVVNAVHDSGIRFVTEAYKSSSGQGILVDVGESSKTPGFIIMLCNF